MNREIDYRVMNRELKVVRVSELSTESILEEGKKKKTRPIKQQFYYFSQCSGFTGA